MLRHRLTALVLSLWLASIALAQFWLLQHQFTPGPHGDTPNVWPVQSAICPQPGRFTLLMFAHPKCPCTRASLAELAKISARSAREVDCHFLYVVPPGAPPEWASPERRVSPPEMPGVHILTDGDGKEAHLFGAEISGLTMLFDPTGKLIFRGGITSGRGHEGDNPGQAALFAWISGHESDVKEVPVFGCPLFDPQGSN